MSERMKRRQFIADALFAGGALGAAALATRWLVSTEPAAPAPVASPTPPPQACSREDLVNARGGGLMAPPDRMRNPLLQPAVVRSQREAR